MKRRQVLLKEHGMNVTKVSLRRKMQLRVKIIATVFQADFSIPHLEKQLAVLVDVIRVELPDVKRVTNIRTICTAMEAHRNRSMLSEVHKLLRLFLTIPVTSMQFVRKELFGDETTFYVFEILHDRKSI